jgi:hypothetical protein
MILFLALVEQTETIKYVQKWWRCWDSFFITNKMYLFHQLNQIKSEKMCFMNLIVTNHM